MMAMPSQVLFIYCSLVSLVYLATDRFNNNAPFAFTIPVIVLGLFTCGTRMKQNKKFLTALSFFMLAAALYHWSVFPKRLVLSGLLIFASHTSYLLSFYRSLRRVWVGLAVITSIITVLFLIFIFADLYRSVPTLVASMCLTMAMCSASFVIAGSVWKNGSAFAYEERSSFVRFAGMFFLMICNSALLINHFAKHTHTVVWYLNFTYYVSQFLLFFANERAF